MTVFGIRSKVLIMVLSFRSSAKKELPTFGTRSKVLIMVFLAFKTFDLLPKNEFDQLPNLTETFDLLFWSCAILSSDQTPYLTAISFFVSPYMYFIVLTERSFEQSLKIVWVVCFCRRLKIFFCTCFKFVNDNILIRK